MQQIGNLVSSNDPLILISAVGLLGLVAFLASRVDPNIALRYD